MNKAIKKNKHTVRTSNDSIYGKLSLIFAIISYYFASNVYLPLGIILFILFVLLAATFFMRGRSR